MSEDPRTYDIRTYGCQMNVHDSERLAGLLEQAGYVRAADGAGDAVDLVVFNTCAVRENADNRLYGNLGRLLPAKQARPGMQIAVGGCLAQKDRGADRRAGRPGSTSSSAPTTWPACRCCSSAPGTTPRRRSRSSSRCRRFPSDAAQPAASRRTRPGCRSRSAATTPAPSASCRACAGPRTTAGPATSSPRSRRWSPAGVIEVTLLGQNVNSYGPMFGDRLAFGKLLRACGEIDGLERVRFTSPHPRDFTDDVIDAMAETAERHARSCTCRCSPARTRC